MFLFLGSSVSVTPGEGGLPLFCQHGLLRNLPVESENRSFRQASDLLKSPCKHSGDCSTAVSGNYHALFTHGNEASAFPAATSWYNATGDREEHLNKIISSYEKYCFRKNDCCDLEYDHLGIQLLFVNLLLEKYLTEDDDYRKTVVRNDLTAFISGEMLSWIPSWVKAVNDNSSTKCYAGIAGLLLGSLQDVVELVNRK